MESIQYIADKVNFEINSENDAILAKKEITNQINELTDKKKALILLRDKVTCYQQGICDHKWKTVLEYHNSRYTWCEKCKLEH